MEWKSYYSSVGESELRVGARSGGIKTRMVQWHGFHTKFQDGEGYFQQRLFVFCDSRLLSIMTSGNLEGPGHTWSDWLSQISIWLRTTLESGPNVIWKDRIPCHPLPPLGPEDVLHFALQDLTFKRKKPVYHPVIGCYKPSDHHPEPVRWLRHSTPAEPDQFSDAEM